MDSRRAAISSSYAWPMPSRKSSAALASTSSIFDSANPTWMRIQSPGATHRSPSRPMLIARLTPQTSTMARSGRSDRISTISPGIPRHMRGLRQLDGFEDEVVAAFGVDVGAAAPRADGEGVGRDGRAPAGAAGHPHGDDDQVHAGLLGHGPLGDRGERLVDPGLRDAEQ